MVGKGSSFALDMTGPSPSSASAPAGGEDFEAAHRDLVADESIQFELEMYEPAMAPPADPPGWLTSLVEWLSQDHPVLQAVIYALFAGAALLILWLVARAVSRSDWWNRSGIGAPGADPDMGLRPAEGPARKWLEEADALAAQCRFSEAVHLLLHRSIDDIDSRRPDLLRPAFTSRDIAALPGIPDEPRSAFARIAMTVERSLFARRDLGESDWQDCRDAYRRFAFAESW